MRLGIVVNVMEGAEAGSTTYRLAAAAVSRGHEVWIMSTGNFSYNADETLGAWARSVPPGRYKSRRFLQLVNGPRAIQNWIELGELDVLLLRSNPSAQKPWAASAGIHFGRLALTHGVIVLNDPDGLSRAINKLYLQNFPTTVRPRTVVTRSLERIEQFLEDQQSIVLKPLQGSGGAGVFLVQRDQQHNLEEIVQSLTRDGYIVAQEYLPAAAEGDMRLFLMNGEPLQHRGRYAAFRRVRTGDDLRSNIHAGGRLRRAEVGDTALRLAEVVRPRLVADGMFLVGLDIVGDKLMEINVFSPGGLGSALLFTRVDFTQVVLDALERKADYMRYYGRNFSNPELATL